LPSAEAEEQKSTAVLVRKKGQAPKREWPAEARKGGGEKGRPGQTGKKKGAYAHEKLLSNKKTFKKPAHAPHEPVAG